MGETAASGFLSLFLASSFDDSQVAANLEESCFVDLTSQVGDKEAAKGPQERVVSDEEAVEGTHEEVLPRTSRPAYPQVAGSLTIVTNGFSLASHG